MNLDPATKPFDSKSLTLSVATNNPTGYQLMMSSDSTSLIKTNDNTKTIPTLPDLAGGYTESTFEDNKWGYKINTGNYIPFVSGATIAENDTTTNDQSTTLTFATKVNYLQAEGTYQTVLNFTAVANVIPVTYIQDLDASLCTTNPLIVVDKRDNEEYLVQRLADGNCWMLDNLRLDPTEVSLDDLKGNTNASDEALTYLKNGGGELASQYATNAVVAKTADGGSWDTSHTYDSPFVATGYKDKGPADVYGWDEYWDAYWDRPVATYGAGSNKIGVYYNLCAASAGSYCYSASDEVGDVKSDICPAGWRLPIGGKADDPANEYNNLYLAYDSNPSDFVNALSASKTGRYLGGAVPESGGYFWSSTSAMSNRIYAISFSSSYVSTSTDIWRDYGHAVRCVRDTRTINDLTYMQDVRLTVVRNTAVGATKTLLDKRDNEEYLVSKLADSNLWMLDNLRLDIATLSRDDLEKGTNTENSGIYCLKTGGCSGSQGYTASAPIAKIADGGSWEDSYDKPYIATGYKDTVASVTYGEGSGKIGIYYNYCAASAGSYCYPEGEGTSDAIYDVCPSNWRLPRGGVMSDSILDSTNEPNNLYLAYDSDQAAFKIALSTPLSNYFYNGSAYQGNNCGYFWTSTIYRPSAMRNFGVYPSSVAPSYSFPRNLGHSIRCISTF